MTLTIHQPADFTLPIKQALIDILWQQMEPTYNAQAFAVTLLFKDPHYDHLKGGYYPVEIRLIKQGHQWYFDYITDFGYIGNYYPELEKITDICWRGQYVYSLYSGDLTGHAAHELVNLWQTNFIAYQQMDVYKTKVIWE